MDESSRGEGSLERAWRVGAEAAEVGFDWEDAQGALAKVSEEVQELGETFSEAEAAHRRRRQQEELGDLLFAAVNVARHLGLDPAEALGRATDRFEARFERVGELAGARGERLIDLELHELEALWQRAKEELTRCGG